MSTADTAAPPLILASDGPIVILLDSGNREYHISRQTALFSGLFSDMLEENDDDDDAVPEIPVTNVDGPTMELVLEYMQHYASGTDTPTELPTPLSGKIEDAVSDWERGFLAKLANEQVEASVIGAGRSLPQSLSFLEKKGYCGRRCRVDYSVCGGEEWRAF